MKSKVNKAPILPPIKEKTYDIFRATLLMVKEFDDLAKKKRMKVPLSGLDWNEYFDA